MTRDQQRLWFAISLLAALPSCSQAAVVTVMTTNETFFTDFLADTISFAPIANADQLVSISGGTVSTFEGGAFTISADYLDGSSAQIFSHQLGFFETFDLNQVSDVAFSNGTLTGLTFSTNNSFSAARGDIPAGATFTFETSVPMASAVPELPTWAMMIGGLAVAGLVLRRKSYHVLTISKI